MDSLFIILGLIGLILSVIFLIIHAIKKKKKLLRPWWIVLIIAIGLLIVGSAIAPVSNNTSNKITTTQSKQTEPSEKKESATTKQEPKTTPTTTQESKKSSDTIPKISDEIKNVTIQGIEGYPEVQDAAISQDGRDLSLALIVNYGTSKEKAKELGDAFIRMVKSMSDDEAPGKDIGKGIYNYMIGVYYPNDNQIIIGAKAYTAINISW